MNQWIWKELYAKNHIVCTSLKEHFSLKRGPNPDDSVRMSMKIQFIYFEFHHLVYLSADPAADMLKLYETFKSVLINV